MHPIPEIIENRIAPPKLLSKVEPMKKPMIPTRIIIMIETKVLSFFILKYLHLRKLRLASGFDRVFKSLDYGAAQFLRRHFYCDLRVIVLRTVSAPFVVFVQRFSSSMSESWCSRRTMPSNMMFFPLPALPSSEGQLFFRFLDRGGISAFRCL